MGNSLPSWRRPDKFDPGADLLRQGLGGGAGAVGDQPFGEAFRNDVLDLLPHQFIAAVAELFFRLHIQQNDFSARVHHHHGVGRRFQQPAVSAFHLRQMLFRVLAHADVADRRCYQRAFRAFERAQHDLDGKLAAILAPPGEFDPGADLLRQGLGGGAGAVGDQPFGEAFGNDVLDLLPHQFIAAVAELFFRLHIQQNDLPARVHHHHGIGRRFQQPAVLRSRLLAFAEIAADLGKAAQISRRVAQCGAGDIGQKTGSHLSAPACLVLRAGRWRRRWRAPPAGGRAGCLPRERDRKSCAR